MYKSYYESFIGRILLISDGNYLIGLYINLEKEGILKDDLEVFKITKKWLDRYFKKEKVKGDELPIKLIGSEFQKKVWRELLEIPYGEVVTYGFIGKKIGNRAYQAVGQAVGSNNLAIVVPCHRVVSKNDIGGFAYGIEIKRKLLELEGMDF